jgi:hypothetical protein
MKLTILTDETERVMKQHLWRIIFFAAAFSAYAQYSDGVLINMQEVDIGKMKSAKMLGAEAVLKVIEQYADGRYRYAFVSNNYLVPDDWQKRLSIDKNRFLIAVAGYPAQNNLVFAQIFYDNSFFFVTLVKDERDMRRTGDIQTTRLNYEKGNAVRRNNIRDTIQRNNIIPLGIDTVTRYY